MLVVALPASRSMSRIASSRLLTQTLAWSIDLLARRLRSWHFSSIL